MTQRPIKRWWLNQETHSKVASSTDSRVFHGLRRWMSSALAGIDGFGQGVMEALNKSTVRSAYARSL